MKLILIFFLQRSFRLSPFHIEAVAANPIKIQGMGLNAETQEVFSRILDVLQSWITEFNHFTAIRTNDMVVLPEGIRPFKLGTVFSELVFPYQVAIQQQLNGIVQCGLA